MCPFGPGGRLARVLNGQGPSPGEWAAGGLPVPEQRSRLVPHGRPRVWRWGLGTRVSLPPVTSATSSSVPVSRVPWQARPPGASSTHGRRSPGRTLCDPVSLLREGGRTEEAGRCRFSAAQPPGSGSCGTRSQLLDGPLHELVF